MKRQRTRLLGNEERKSLMSEEMCGLQAASLGSALHTVTLPLIQSGFTVLVVDLVRVQGSRLVANVRVFVVVLFCFLN